jgi:hypothetical protein
MLLILWMWINPLNGPSGMKGSSNCTILMTKCCLRHVLTLIQNQQHLVCKFFNCKLLTWLKILVTLVKNFEICSRF